MVSAFGKFWKKVKFEKKMQNILLEESVRIHLGKITINYVILYIKQHLKQ